MPRAGAAQDHAELINATLRDEMKRDERIVIYGEDVADASARTISRKAGEREGRVFKLTPDYSGVRLGPRVQFAYCRGNIVGTATEWPRAG